MSDQVDPALTTQNTDSPYRSGSSQLKEEISDTNSVEHEDDFMILDDEPSLQDGHSSPQSGDNRPYSQLPLSLPPLPVHIGSAVSSSDQLPTAISDPAPPQGISDHPNFVAVMRSLQRIMESQNELLIRTATRQEALEHETLHRLQVLEDDVDVITAEVEDWKDVENMLNDMASSHTELGAQGTFPDQHDRGKVPKPVVPHEPPDFTSHLASSPDSSSTSESRSLSSSTPTTDSKTTIKQTQITPHRARKKPITQWPPSGSQADIVDLTMIPEENEVASSSYKPSTSTRLQEQPIYTSQRRVTRSSTGLSPSASSRAQPTGRFPGMYDDIPAQLPPKKGSSESIAKKEFQELAQSSGHGQSVSASRTPSGSAVRRRKSTGPLTRLSNRGSQLGMGDGIVRVEVAEWPQRQDPTVIGLLKCTCCDICQGMAHWACAGYEENYYESDMIWICPDCDALSKESKSTDRTYMGNALRCIRPDCIMRLKKKVISKAGDENLYVIEKLLGIKEVESTVPSKKARLYLVKWLDWSLRDSTWGPAENIPNVDDFIFDFHQAATDAGIDVRKKVVLLPQALKAWDERGELKGGLVAGERGVDKGKAKAI